MYFIFYFLYLIAAQFPLFLLLIIRNGDSNYLLFIYLFMLSILILLCLLSFMKLRLEVAKNPPSNIRINSGNLANNTMSDFFSFFLLPFFTFNLVTSNSNTQKLIEIFFIFVLLTLYLYRSGNLLINPLLFFFFNLYRGESAGNNYILLLPRNRTNSSVDCQNENNFIQITNNILYFHYDAHDYRKTILFIKRTIIILILVLVLCSLFLFLYFTNFKFLLQYIF